MKIINTSFRHNNAFHKMKGNISSSFPQDFTNKDSSLTSYPSGFTDSENLEDNSHKSHKLAYGALALLAVPLLIYAATTGKLTESPRALLQGFKGRVKKFFTPGSLKVENYGEFLEKTNEYIGEGFYSARVEKFKSLLGEEKAAKLLTIEDDTIEFVEASNASKLLNGILDIPRIFIDAPNAAIRGAKKIPFIGKLGIWDTIANIPVFKNRADQKAAMDIFYRLKGMAEFSDNPVMIKNEIFGVPKGPAVANYVTKDERGLNRLATGMVSATFAGTDYYNLAMYEKNDHKEAKKSAKKRVRRERLRILMHAGFTYSVLSAFSSYVNKSKVLACVAIAGTAFVTEVLSRVFTGTPLRPLSANGAKKLNKKRAEKKAKIVEKLRLKGRDAAKNPAVQPTSNSPVSPAAQAPQTVMQPVWYQNTALNSAFSQFAPANSNMQFKGEVVKTDATKKNEASAAKPDVEPQNNARVDKNKPFGLKHLVGVALAALGISLIYCAARTKSPKFNAFLDDAANFLHNLRKLVSTKDMIVKDGDLKKFFEGFDGLQSEHIRRGYSVLTDVEFTREQAEMLLAKARKGVISIDKDNPVFARAYIRTSAMLDPLFNKGMQDHVAFDPTQLGTRNSCRYEAAELAGGRSILISKRHYDVPEYAETKKGLREIIRELTKKPEPYVEYNLDGSLHEYGTVSDVMQSSVVRKQMIEENEVFHSNQKFKNIKFTLDLNEPSVVRDGVAYYKMKDAVFNFGKIEETRAKIVIDALEHPAKMIKTVFTLPLKLFRKITGIAAPKAQEENKAPDPIKRFLPDLGEFYRDCSPMYKKYKKGKISKEEFAKYIESVNMKPFSAETSPRYSPTALASTSRNFVAAISTYFFVNDFRNEVLLQSDGENKEKANAVAKERLAHKGSNFVLNKFFMEIFNNTFNKQYLSSLLGATLVAAATEVTNESTVRASIGVPTKKMDSREEINEYEKKHLEAKGIKGAYYRFMARLTGKKMLSEKAEK